MSEEVHSEEVHIISMPDGSFDSVETEKELDEYNLQPHGVMVLSVGVAEQYYWAEKSAKPFTYEVSSGGVLRITRNNVDHLVYSPSGWFTVRQVPVED